MSLFDERHESRMALEAAYIAREPIEWPEDRYEPDDAPMAAPEYARGEEAG